MAGRVRDRPMTLLFLLIFVAYLTVLDRAFQDGSEK